MHTHSRQRTALSLALVTLLAVVGLAANPPRAAATGWPQSTTNTATDTVVTHPNGAATLLSCGTYDYADRQYALRTINADGTDNTTIDNEQDNEVSLSACTGDDVVSADGTVFAHEADGNTGDKDIVAYKNSAELWRRATTTGCSSKVDPEARAVGSDGNLYLLYRSCGNDIELVRLNATTGAVQFQTIIDGTSSPVGLEAYNGGVVYRRVGSSSVEWRYFNHSGVEDTTKARTMSAAWGEYLTDFSVNAAGKVFVGFVKHNVSSCGGAYNILMKVVSYDPQTGNEATYNTASHCLRDHSGIINPLPSGGAVVRMTDSSNDGHLMYLGASSGVTVHALPKPLDINGTVTYSAPQVDVNGNVVVVGKFSKQNDSRDRPFVEVLLYDSAGNRLARHQPAVAANEYFRLPSQVPFGLAQGYVYLPQCHTQSCANNTNAQTLHKIAFAEIGIDYPRGAVLGVSANPVVAKKYVALGDSYSSGQGVVPFDPDTDNPGANECYRSYRAYPELLADDASLNLSYGKFAACGGAKTIHIVNTTHNGEVPQSDALDSNTGVVTVTIGGNDVGFGDIGVACNVPGPQRSTMCANAIQAAASYASSSDFQNKLDAAYEKIAEEAPSAQVFVIGYPQIFPEPSEVTSLGCFWSWGPAVTAITPTELYALRGITAQVNSRIQSRATAHGFEYVNLAGAFSGHSICTTEPLIFDVTPTDLNRIYHPTQEGQKLIAEVVRNNMY